MRLVGEQRGTADEAFVDAHAHGTSVEPEVLDLSSERAWAWRSQAATLGTSCAFQRPCESPTHHVHTDLTMLARPSCELARPRVAAEHDTAAQPLQGAFDLFHFALARWA
jgi:hypothetical protein